MIFAILGSLTTLPAVSWLFSNALPALLIAIPVIFQPELRRALERVGRAVQIGGQRTRHATDTDHMISIIAQACQRLADRKHGALIVLERATGLESYADTGVKIDAVITSELLAEHLLSQLAAARRRRHHSRSSRAGGRLHFAADQQTT